ncbi:hypothetical protein TNCV_697311 [Trichonephila clavipes]|nr:hypothetical protein TNCV_697311 [Trichonephila clavipes]
MDELMDTKDTAVDIFIQVVDRFFTIVEELTSVVAPKGTTRGSEYYSSLTQTLDRCELDFSNISVLITDGVKSKTGKNISGHTTPI